jgi:HEAT repeat protein
MLSPDAAKTAVPELIDTCRQRDLETKKSALLALVKLVTPEMKVDAKPLVAALKESDLEVRRNAALALANLGSDESAAAVPVLLEALKHGDADLRRQAAAAFRGIGPRAKSAIPLLTAAFIDPKDTKLRVYAAVALGGMKEDAAAAVPTLVKVLANTKDDTEVRVQAAVALSAIGPVAAAGKAVPTLIKIVENPSETIVIRERTLWALRVHRRDLLDFPGVTEAFTRIISERKAQDSRMLRYDCGYILGMLLGPQAPAKTLDVLLEFLHDDKIAIYESTGTGVTGTGEKEKGGAKVTIRTKGDGRMMAVQALREIGPARLKNQPKIIEQLRVLQRDENLYRPLRDEAAALLKALGG